MAQAIHAAVDLALEDPKRAAEIPNTVVLSVINDDDLLAWNDRATEAGLKPALFHEPDLDGQATALAVYSTGELFSALPLAGREVQLSTA